MKAEELKQVMGAILSQFLKVEGGNKVTQYNLRGLMQELIDAVDGKITLKPQEETPKENKE